MNPVYLWLPESFKDPLSLVVTLYISTHFHLSDFHIVFSLPQHAGVKTVSAPLSDLQHTQSEFLNLISFQIQSVWSDFLPTLHIAVS